MSFNKALNVIQIELLKTYVSPIYVITCKFRAFGRFGIHMMLVMRFSFLSDSDSDRSHFFLIPASFSAGAVESIYNNATNKLRHFNCSDFICHKSQLSFILIAQNHKSKIWNNSASYKWLLVSKVVR